MKKVLTVILTIMICLHSFMPCFAFEELSKGSKGDAVVELQNRLNELGYDVGIADGDFGGKTEKAIKLFQQDNGLAVTGKMDNETYNALFIEESIDLDSNSNNPISENALFLIKGDNGFGYCNAEGEVVIPCKWYDAEDFVCGVAKVQEEKDGYYGFINIAGEYVIPCEWE